MFQRLKERMVLHAPDGGGGGGSDDDTDLTDKEKDFEAFVLTLPEEHRPAAKSQHEKLITAMKSERLEKKKEAKRRKELEDADTERKNKELSAADLLKKENETLADRVTKAEGDLQTERVRTRFISEAGKSEFGEGEKKQRFIDPDAAYDLAVARKFEMKLDGGKPTGITEALKELAKMTYLLEPADTGASRQPGPKKGKEPGPEMEEQKRQEMIERKRAEYSPL